MNYELATKKDLQEIYDLVQHTIKTIYPKYYLPEVVDFFCNYHSKDAILKDIENANVIVIKMDHKIVGTGSFLDNNITRIYVLPECQKKGYGSFLISALEEEIAKKFNKAVLEASLPAATLYDKLGYSTVKHEKYIVENDVVLAYDIMEKELYPVTTDINYNKRTFVPKMNSANGEVNDQTTFLYHQNNKLLWAEYSGGDILKGTLLGTVSQNGELDFVYEHMNQDMKIKTGKCHSVPTVLEDGKIQLSEEWEWTCGDCSRGTSVLMEV